MFKNYIYENKDNLIQSVCDLIKIPSVSDENSGSEYPFGKSCNDALDYILNLAQNLGFRTKNLDGYCGYIEFGEGEELVGIIGHLDVVPAKFEDGWTNDPFIPTIRENKIYGRGAIDDKGPVIASLYAMKAIMDKAKISKRVRLIIGLNEERNWKCINYYKNNEEHPSIGFSPDADFPGIFAEKGIISIKVSKNIELNNFEILDIDCNQNAINVVPKKCSITLKKKKINLNPNKLPMDFKFENSDLIEIENIDSNTVKITANGISAHAAHPHLGKNAITILIRYLIDNLGNYEPSLEYFQRLFHLGFFEIESPEFLSRKEIEYCTEFEDDSCIQDESGSLTSNIGKISHENNMISLSLNLRVPVHTSLDKILFKYKQLIRFYEDIIVEEISRQEPLCSEKDSYLVKNLVNIFNEETGLNAKPIAIGGGTYARAFPNFISYGANMPGDVDLCHQVDEFIDIDKMLTASCIYAKAIHFLAN